VSSNWSDLGPRVGSAIAMAAIGIGAIWLGGLVFAALVAGALGVVVWEMTRMLAPDAEPAIAPSFGVMAALVLLACAMTNPVYALILIVLTIAGLYKRLPNEGERNRFALYLGWVLLAGYALVLLRANEGLETVLWVVAIVVATDIAGYFAGRLIGGPKFWPRISPKKTWAGTIAGWLAAGLIGLAWGGAPMALAAAALAFASQMGDAAESALKRHTGTKDSSDLIPGHGGVFDRFDALLGAALVAGVIGALA